MERELDGKEVRVRIRATGQILDMVPIAARALLNAGTAELADQPAPIETKRAALETKPAAIETTAVEGSEQTATSRDQRKPKHKSAR